MEVPVQNVVDTVACPRDTVDKYEMRFGAAHRLSEFPNFKFFSPALPYLHGGFTDEPLLVFMSELGREVKFLHRRFRRPLFCGMEAPAGDPAWNYVLWAVAIDVWRALDNFLLSVVTTHTPSHAVYRLGVQDVVIADPLEAEQLLLSGQPTPFSVAVFGVDSNRGVMALDVPPTLLSMPIARRHKPQGRTKRFANALFGMEDPLLANAILAEAREPMPPAEPVVLRTKDFEALPPEKQAEYLALIQRYRKEIL